MNDSPPLVRNVPRPVLSGRARVTAGQDRPWHLRLSAGWHGHQMSGGHESSPCPWPRKRGHATRAEKPPGRFFAALTAAILAVLCITAPAIAAGEVLPPATVLARHNAWAARIPHLWARADLMLNFPKDEAGTEREQHDLSGHLFLDKPDRLFVHGEVLGKDVFKVGMNPERFWLWIRPEVNTVWTGRRGGEGEKRFILSPADLMTAIGLFRIDLGPATPAEFVAQRDHYVLTERYPPAAAPGPRRRIWFDRETLRPARVDLFDRAARRLLMAELLRYKPVGPGKAPLATAYRARFYGEGREMILVLRLTEVKPEKEPNPRVFEYRRPPGAKVRDLDADEPNAGTSAS